MGENILDKHKCPLCGNIVVSKFKQNCETSYSTIHATWYCTKCGAEFEALFFNNFGKKELIYKEICIEPQELTEMNILGHTGRI